MFVLNISQYFRAFHVAIKAENRIVSGVKRNFNFSTVSYSQPSRTGGEIELSRRKY